MWAHLLFGVVALWHRALQRTGLQIKHSSFINPALIRRLVQPRWSPSLLAKERQEAPHICLNLIRGQERIDQRTAGGGEWWSADEEGLLGAPQVLFSAQGLQIRGRWPGLGRAQSMEMK